METGLLANLAEFESDTIGERVRAVMGSRVEQGKQTPDQAWAQVLEDVKKIK